MLNEDILTRIESAFDEIQRDLKKFEELSNSIYMEVSSRIERTIRTRIKRLEIVRSLCLKTKRCDIRLLADLNNAKKILESMINSWINIEPENLVKILRYADEKCSEAASNTIDEKLYRVYEGIAELGMDSIDFDKILNKFKEKISINELINILLELYKLGLIKIRVSIS